MASQYIKILKNIGVLEENRRGFRVFYTINLDILMAYKKEIDELFKKAIDKCPDNELLRQHYKSMLIKL